MVQFYPWFNFYLPLFLYTVISINFDGSKYKDKTSRFCGFLSLSASKSAMPRPSSEDIRWQAIWMKEMLRYQKDEVAALLKMSLSFKL